MKRFFCLCLSLVMVLSLFAGCSNSADDSSKDNNQQQNQQPENNNNNQQPENNTPAYSGTVMLYSSMQEDQLVAIKQAFEKKYPGITMEYYFAGTSKVVTKISTEAQAGQDRKSVV